MTKDEQIIKAALEDGNLSYSQAAAYRLLLRCAEQLSKEEASGGRSAATPSPDQFSGAKSNKGEAPCSTGNVNFSGPAPESGLDPRVEEIYRGHDGVWRAYGYDDSGKMMPFGESANLADLVGVNDKAYIMIGELQIENSKLRGHAEALERQVAEIRGDWRIQERAALTAERDEALNEVRRLRNDRDEARRTRDVAQAECNRLLGVKRRIEEELEATQSDCKAMRGKLDTAAMVRAFNRKFGVPIAAIPAFPERDRMDLRVRLIAEEFTEFLAACGYEHEVDIHRQGQKACVFYASCSPSVVPDMIAAADGLADLQYVTEGTALEFGIPLADVFAEVHRSNMTKTGQPDSGGKIAKGDGYEPPQIDCILREHGWEG